MKRARNAGAVAVEFAIIGTVFVSLLLLAMEAGWQMVIEAALGAGGRAASRFGTTGTLVAAGVSPPPTTRDGSILQLVLLNSGGLLQPTLLTIAETSYANFADAKANVHPTGGAGNASQVVQYNFTYKQPYLTPMAIAITNQDFLLHSLAVTVLNEPFPTP
jgi:Flp pilus assembly protein TadG